MNVMNYEDKKSIGSVNFTTGEIYIGDPCYGAEDLEKLTIKPGLYEFFICKDQGCNSALIMSLGGHNYSKGKFECSEKVFGVDSGQGGIFEVESFNTDEIVIDCKKYDFGNSHSEFYKAMGYITLTETDIAGVYPKGAVSSSGYGDGSYNIYVVRNKDREIVAVALAFIEDNRFECCGCYGLFEEYELDDNGYCYNCGPEEEEEEEEREDKYW